MRGADYQWRKIPPGELSIDPVSCRALNAEKDTTPVTTLQGCYAVQRVLRPAISKLAHRRPAATATSHHASLVRCVYGRPDDQSRSPTLHGEAHGRENG